MYQLFGMSLHRGHDAGARRAPTLRPVATSAKPFRPLAVLLTTAAMSGVGGALAFGEPAKPAAPKAPAVPAAPSNEELLRKVQCMEQRIRALEGQLKAQTTAPAAATEAPQPFNMRFPEPLPTRGSRASNGTLKTPPAKDAGQPDPPAPPMSAEGDAKPVEPGANPAEPAAKPAPSTAKPAVAPDKAAAAPKPDDPCAPLPKTQVAKTNPSSPLLPPLPDGSAPAPAAAPAEQQLLPPLPGGPSPSAASTAGKKGILGVADSPVAGLSIGAYGELKYGSLQNPAANGQWQNGFDAHRLVLLPTYAITPNIIFNAEIEFEHGGTGFDADDKLHGTAEIEQLFVDFKIVDQFNWRAPGIDLVPIGYINQHHEPTQFYSVNRPPIYNGLIPSTWKAPASSFLGAITDGVNYQVQVSSSLEDFGDDFALRTDANTVPLFPTPYGAGIDGLTALGFSLPVRGDFRQLSNDLAYAGKLDFTPPAVPGLGFSVSAYYTPNTTPRGAHDDWGNPLGRTSLTMFDAEFRYRVPKTWLEFRGEYVRAIFGNPINLRANNDSDPTNDVGKSMYGYYGEVALHVPLGTILGSEWKAVPFYRYTYQNLQTCPYGSPAGVAGIDLCLPTGSGQTRFQDFGVAVFPSPQIVLKATYQRVRNNNPDGAQVHPSPIADSILGGVGFFF